MAEVPPLARDREAAFDCGEVLCFCLLAEPVSSSSPLARRLCACDRMLTPSGEGGRGCCELAASCANKAAMPSSSLSSLSIPVSAALL